MRLCVFFWPVRLSCLLLRYVFIVCYIYSGTSASLWRAAAASFLLLGETCSQLLGKANDKRRCGRVRD